MAKRITAVPEKNHKYLAHLFDTDATQDIHELLLHSELYLFPDTMSANENAKFLGLSVDPEVYKKHHENLINFSKKISNKYAQFTYEIITRTEFIPQLSKFQILNNTITPVLTPWEEINRDQENLISQQRTACEIVDYQNIGNSSRTILQKLSNLIFDPLKHTATDSIDLSEGKFKNRLHTYIKNELGGSENKELREYSLSLISTCEKSIDLTNKLTHDLRAGTLTAEICVISTITVISIIKLINLK